METGSILAAKVAARAAAGSIRCDWAALIEAQRASGQTVKAFCKAQGVATSSFFEWRRKLSAVGQSPKDARFVEMAVTQQAPAGAGELIELELRQGRRVLILRRGFDPALLREALWALEQAWEGSRR